MCDGECASPLLYTMYTFTTLIHVRCGNKKPTSRGGRHTVGTHLLGAAAAAAAGRGPRSPPAGPRTQAPAGPGPRTRAERSDWLERQRKARSGERRSCVGEEGERGVKEELESGWVTTGWACCELVPLRGGGGVGVHARYGGNRWQPGLE
jgi:hypothetical protein